MPIHKENGFSHGLFASPKKSTFLVAGLHMNYFC